MSELINERVNECVNESGNELTVNGCMNELTNGS